ncbi:MAG: MgtC/SapB family protein [Steroidobacteraceae bacterium]
MLKILSLSLPEVLARIGMAIVCGAALGLNRDFYKKPAGLRTFSIVSLASATVSLVMVELSGGDVGGVSRTVQGILTGIGFLGAGVIMHGDTGSKKVSGLTTAAAVWLAAVLGITCGLGLLQLAAIVLASALAILTLGRPIERWLKGLIAPRHSTRVSEGGAPRER